MAVRFKVAPYGFVPLQPDFSRSNVVRTNHSWNVRGQLTKCSKLKTIFCRCFCVSTHNKNASSSLQSFVFPSSSSRCFISVFRCFFMSSNEIFHARNFTKSKWTPTKLFCIVFIDFMNLHKF